MPVKPGDQLGQYQIVRELGRGGMATVYQARDASFQREVAIKVLPREYLHDPNFRARFEREARTIAALEHPSIVPVYDFGEQDGQLYLVMRYMSGGSLAERLKHGPLPIDEIATILEQIGSALDHAHSQGLVHRDVKPANILFDRYGAAFLADFGIVKMRDVGTALTGSELIGTPDYISPEQGRGERKLDGRSDLYSLGVILFEALAGRLPYHADTPIEMVTAHIVEPVPSILAARPDLPPACEAIITRAMAKTPIDRYATAGDLARDLRQLVFRFGDTRVEAAEGATIIEPEPWPAPRPVYSARPAPGGRTPAEPHLVEPKRRVGVWIGLVAVSFALCLVGGLGLAFVTGRLSGLNLLPASRAVEHYKRGLDYQQQQLPDLALAEFDQAIALDPDYVDAYIGRGQTHLDLDDFDLAIVDFDQALALDAGRAEAYTGRGNANQEKNDLDQALADFDRAIALDPQLAAAYAGRGYTYTERGEYERALADYDKAIALDPQDAEAFYGRGRVHIFREEPEQAVADLDQAIELDPQNARAYNARGVAYLNLGEADRAMAEFSQAIVLDAGFSFPYLNRGNIYRDRGDYELAIADYTRAIAIDPQGAEAYKNRGLAYYNTGEYDQVIADLNQAIGLDPQDAWAYNIRGLAYYYKAEYDSALTDFNQAIALDPQYAWAYNNRGNVYYFWADYNRAIGDYTRALTLDPQYATAYFNRGLTYYMLSDDNRALADIDKAIGLDPEVADYYYQRGSVFLRRGEGQRAVQEYSEAIARDPQYAEAYYWRAAAYESLGDRNQAIADYERALELGLSPELAQQAVGRLQVLRQ